MVFSSLQSHQYQIWRRNNYLIVFHGVMSEFWANLSHFWNQQCHKKPLCLNVFKFWTYPYFFHPKNYITKANLRTKKSFQGELWVVKSFRIWSKCHHPTCDTWPSSRSKKNTFPTAGRMGKFSGCLALLSESFFTRLDLLFCLSW